MKSEKARRAHVQTMWFLPNHTTCLESRGLCFGRAFFYGVPGRGHTYLEVQVLYGPDSGNH